MSSPHLNFEDLVDIAEGTRPAPAHVQTCDACQRELADLRSTMAAVADVDVPEPSPLFWDHLSARVKEAVGAEPPPRWSLTDAWAWRVLLPVGAIALVVLAVTFEVSRSRPPEAVENSVARSATEPDAPAVSAQNPDQAGDPSLDLIADLSEGLDWDAATAAGWTTATSSLDQAFDQLNDAERATLHQLLQDALSGKGA